MHRTARFVKLYFFLTRQMESTAPPLPGALTVVDRVGSAATTRLQFGVNIIPLRERSGGAITDEAREGSAHSCRVQDCLVVVGGVRGEAGGEGV